MLSYLENNKALLYFQAIVENLMHSWRTKHIYWYFNSYFILTAGVWEPETSLLQCWGHIGHVGFPLFCMCLSCPLWLMDVMCAHRGRKNWGPRANEHLLFPQT